MHSALVVKLHLLHQMSQLCLILPSQSQLEASTRTNLRLGNVPVEVGLGSCSLRQSNKNNQKVDISKKKQAGVREENKQSGILKKIMLIVREIIGKSTHRKFSIKTWFTACGISEQCLLQAPLQRLKRDGLHFSAAFPTLSFISLICFLVKTSDITLGKVSVFSRISS